MVLRLADHCQFRVLNVAIELGYEDVLGHLANAMDLMPNLHTIQIICAAYRASRASKKRVIKAEKFLKAFESHAYPVRRVVLPIQARGVLASMPAAVDVYMNSPYVYRFPLFATALASYCPVVESFGWEEVIGLSTAGMCILLVAVPISYRVQ